MNHRFIVEIFRTNVSEPTQAALLVAQIHERFRDYHANFDLQDKDRILRIKSENSVIGVGDIIDFMRQSGFYAEVLPGELEYGSPFYLPNNVTKS